MLPTSTGWDHNRAGEYSSTGICPTNSREERWGLVPGLCPHTRAYVRARALARLTHFGPEHGCRMYLQNISNTAHINQAQIPRAKSTSIYVRIILPCIYTSPEWTIALGLLHQIYQNIFHSLTRATYFVNMANSSWFHHPINDKLIKGITNLALRNPIRSYISAQKQKFPSCRLFLLV
jgi:hypothetical protein